LTRKPRSKHHLLPHIALRIGWEMPNSHAVMKQARSLEPKSGCRLLVSVRDCGEAIAAIDGGCDILDIKEPNRGSLGMADVATMQSIVEAVRSHTENRKAISISAALGELADWANVDEIPRLPAGVDYVKLGLSRMRNVARWQDRFQYVQREFDRQKKGAMATALRGHASRGMPTQSCGHGTHQLSPDVPLRWIAVIYADEQLAESPPPNVIMKAAGDTTCAGILIDTFEKNGRTLLDWMEPDELHRIAEQAHAMSLTFALAGSLAHSSLPQLTGIGADVIAVRSAVCVGANRRANVSDEAVLQFKNAMGSLKPDEAGIFHLAQES
jgi:uncharacterized protein (UPF0264 family)